MKNVSETKPTRKLSDLAEPISVRSFDPRHSTGFSAKDHDDFKEKAISTQRFANRNIDGGKITFYAKAKDGNEYPLEDFLGKDFVETAEVERQAKIQADADRRDALRADRHAAEHEAAALAAVAEEEGDEATARKPRKR